MLNIQSVEEILSNHFKTEVSITSKQTLGGGSINNAFKIETNMGVFFLKENSHFRFPSMFSKESKGLEILKKTGIIDVPDVICYGDDKERSYLMLSHIDSANKSSFFWDDFANKLAKLHRLSAESFGLDHDNYIGSLVQYNSQCDKWSDFFRDMRLEVQIKLARDSSLIDISVVKAFERFYNRIEEIFPEEPNSLLHGDLWSGNFMVGKDGIIVLIDPAVYYGHREMDIAMTQLFGGFSSEFYTKYNTYYPMENGWEKRMDYCNLYPLMVHVNLFGGGYANSVKSIISEF